MEVIFTIMNRWFTSPDGPKVHVDQLQDPKALSLNLFIAGADVTLPHFRTGVLTRRPHQRDSLAVSLALGYSLPW